MARREIVVYTDDLTGEETSDVTTVSIVFKGIAYEVDMSERTLAAYAKSIQPYLDAGRRVGRAAGTNVIRPAFGGSASATRQPWAEKQAQNKAIRDWWAKSQGRDGLQPLVERGRIPQPVIEAYHKHGGMTIPAPEPTPVQPDKAPRKAGTVGAEARVTETKQAPVKGKSTSPNPARTSARAATVKAEPPRRAGRRRAAS